MKLNNKGFAISSIMYIILVLAVVLIALTLSVLSSRKLILDKLRNEVLTAILDEPNITYKKILNQLKSDAINYMNDNSLEKSSLKIENMDSDVDSETLERYTLNDKYITAVKNAESYNVYLGKTNVVSNVTELPQNTLDIISYKVYGNSYQKKYSGKNLLPIYGNHQNSINDLTLTIEDDILTLNGTISVNDQFGLYIEEGELKIKNSIIGIENDNSSLMNLEPGTYTQSLKYISGSISGESEKYLGLYTYKNGIKELDKRTAFGEEDSTKTFTLTDKIDAQFFVIQFVGINTPITFSDYKFQLQIEKGSVATDYEPYVGGVESPNLDYPQEVESVGDKKNLYNPAWDTRFTKQDDGSYLSNTNIDTSNILGNKKLPIEIYTVSFKVKSPSGTNYRIEVVYSDGTTTSVSNTSNGKYIDFCFTTERKQIEKIIWNYDSQSSAVQFKEFQIESGNIRTEYEPYGYKISIKASGKNLFNKGNIDLTLHKVNMRTQTITPDSTLILQPNTYKVTLFTSNKIDMKNKLNYSVLLLQNGEKKEVYLESGTLSTNGVFTVDTETTVRGIYVFLSSSDNNTAQITIDNIQLEEGTEASEYSPYVEPTITNIYLDEPLRKVDDYDDYIDFKNKKLVRNVSKLELTGEEDMNVNTYFTSANGYQLLSKYVSDYLTQSTYGFSNYFTLGKSSQKNTTSGIIFGQNINMVVPYEANLSTKESFKSKIAELYASGKPLEIYYILSSEKIIDAELPNLNTNFGVTRISIDSKIKPSNYEFTIIEKMTEI